MKRCKICKGEITEEDLKNVELEEIYICSYCGTEQSGKDLVIEKELR